MRATLRQILALLALTTPALAQSDAPQAQAQAQISVGASVVGPEGAPVGTVTSVGSDFVTIKTDKYEVRLPKTALGARPEQRAERFVEPPDTAEPGGESDFRHGQMSFVDQLLGKQNAARLGDGNRRRTEMLPEQPTELPFAQEICEAVVVRSGQDPIVVNLDLETPEPASAGLPDHPLHPERQQ